MRILIASLFTCLALMFSAEAGTYPAGTFSGITDNGNETVAATLGVTGSLTVSGGVNVNGGPLFVNASSQFVGTVILNTHPISQGFTAPTLVACSTGALLSAMASDLKGSITQGTAATGCTLTITNASASASGNKYTYHCIQ